MVGTGERAEKVRTYNYPQNRITEHRLQLTLYKLDRFIHGDLDEVLVPLRTHHQAERLHRELGIETSVATAATSGGVDD
jgi:peptide chain release factor 1